MSGIRRYVLPIAAAFMLLASQPGAAIPISSYEELCLIGKDASYPLSGAYELVDDIDARASQSTRLFEPIGTYERPFTGTFDGKGRYIRDLYIRRPSIGYVGLFGHIGRGAVVRGVGIAGVSVSGQFAVGALAGGNDGTVENCYASGDGRFLYGSGVSAERAESNAGGLVGVNGGTISKSYSAVNVSGKENVGGLVGLLVDIAGGVIKESYARGEVSGSGRAGGLVGYTFGGTVTNCYSAGLVIGGRQAGGLVGADYGSTATNYRRYGTVSAANGGEVRPAVVSGSFWDTDSSSLYASAGGTGKSAEEMRRQGTYGGWDFGNTWVMEGTGAYPGIREVTMGFASYYVSNTGMGRIQVSGSDSGHISYDAVIKAGVPGPYVTAVAMEGYKFVGWSDGVTEPGRRDFVPDALVSFRAEFEPRADTVSVTFAAGAGGTLTVEDETGMQSYTVSVPYGGSGPLVVAAADAGYKFYKWSDGVITAARTANASSGAELTAEFVPASVSILTYSADGSMGVLRVAGLQGVVMTYRTLVNMGESGPEVTYVPNFGYRFGRWSDGVTDSARVDVGEGKDINVSVWFTEGISIGSLTELLKIGADARYPLTGTYVQSGDIDASASRTMNSGAGFAPIKNFRGTFNGNGFAIRGLYINSTQSFIGLFSSTDSSTALRRIRLVDAEIKGGGFTGGLAGSNSGQIINCSVHGTVSSTGSPVGGLAGSNGSVGTGSITGSYSAGSVVSTTNDYATAGGLVGTNRGSITGSYSTSAVTSTGDANTIDNIGGLVGSNYGRITRSFATGSVRRNGNGNYSYVGGLVGSNSGSAATGIGSVTECYSVGAVTNSVAQSAGGLIADGDGEVLRSYWNTATSGRTTSAGGDGAMGRTTAEMRQQSTYDGWDFATVWAISASENGGYPYLIAIGAPSLAKRPELAGANSASARTASPRVSVRGRVLTVTSPDGSDLRVRLFDMRGKTAASYKLNASSGSGRLPLVNIPAGKYIAEVRSGGSKRLIIRSSFILK